MKNSFAEMSFEELIVKRDEVRRQLHELRAQIIMGRMNNTVQKRNLRRQIARLNTRIYNVIEVENKDD